MCGMWDGLGGGGGGRGGAVVGVGAGTGIVVGGKGRCVMSDHGGGLRLHVVLSQPRLRHHRALRARL